MRVLVLGASGFIGRHLIGRLVAEGVETIAAGRDPARLTRLCLGAAPLACDLSRDNADIWADRLAGLDAVINCAGLMGAGADYERVHDRGARALFEGAKAAGVGRILQISALGADEFSPTAYHQTKRAADEHLAALCGSGAETGWAIIRPSLVIGRGGASSALFCAMAASPLAPVIGSGEGPGWKVQPIHIDDLIEAILRLLRRPLPMALRLDAVGPEPMSIDALTDRLRVWLGLRPPLARLRAPLWAMRLAARLRIGPVTRESLIMLEAGNIAPVEPFAAEIGFRPRPLAEALARSPASRADVVAARLAPMEPVLRMLLALVWLAGGLVSLGFAPPSVIDAWLGRLGLAGASAAMALWAGSVADILIGLGLILKIRGAALIGVVVTLAYSAILLWIAPELLADPLGALVKNLAIIGLSLAVHALEGRHG